MNIADFIIELYCKIDDTLPDLPQHPEALLSRNEVVTIGVLHAIKNVSRRAFYSWLQDNYGHFFPKLPERTRLFRRLETQACWTGYFLAQPTILGVANSYGIELGHPVRSGRNLHQMGGQDQSSLDCGWQALHRHQPTGPDRRLGLRHGQRPRPTVLAPAGRL